MHVPLIYNYTKYGNKSVSHGMYGDVLREMDNAVNDIVSAVHETGIDKNTLIWFSCKYKLDCLNWSPADINLLQYMYSILNGRDVRLESVHCKMAHDLHTK